MSQAEQVKCTVCSQRAIRTGPGLTCLNCGAPLDEAVLISSPVPQGASNQVQTRGQALTLVVSSGVIVAAALIGIVAVTSMPVFPRILPVGLLFVAGMGSVGLWAGLKDLTGLR